MASDLGDFEDDTLEGIFHEVSAALAQITPIIRGLTDRTKTDLTPPTKAFVQSDLELNQRLQVTEQAVLQKLSELEQALADMLAAGYPDVPPQTASPEIYAELAAQEAAWVASFGEFARGVLTPGPGKPTIVVS